MTRPPWSEFRAALDAAEYRPSKTLGQNFLLDGNMARSLVRDAGVQEGDRVVEIGAGCGFLTIHLAEARSSVLAVEIDRRLHAIASSFLAPFDSVQLLRADALAGKHALSDELSAALPSSGPWKVVANLPYAISGPLLVLLSRTPNPPASLSVLVQREVAEKAAAQPGTEAWGALPARLDLDYERRVGRRVPAQLFWPRPRVESQVVHLERRPGPGLPPAALAAVDRLIDVLFQQRRKTLLACLAADLGDRQRAARALEAAEIAPGLRPAALPREALLALARAVGDPEAGAT